MNKKVIVNVKNIVLFIVLLFLVGLAISDLIILATSLAMYTWFGLATILLTLWGISAIVEYFEDYLEKKEVSAGTDTTNKKSA
jgi:hypothetical protein